MIACIGEPVSWFRLECYQLGELSSEDAQRVAAHVAECSACRACLEQIARDRREPAFDAPLSAAAAPRRPKPSAHVARWFAAVSATLAVWLMLRPGRETPGEAPALAPQATKGGEVALWVVRRDAAGRALEPDRFAAGDRFKLLLTCPPPLRGPVRVRIFQAGEVYEPIPQQSLASCGNRRALGGAWQFDGAQPLDVCAVFSEQLSDAQLESAPTAAALVALAVPHACAHLEPETPAADGGGQ